jgi:hypothetical protein
MKTLGIDIASQPDGTASCSIKWEQSSAEVEKVEHKLADDRLKELLSGQVHQSIAAALAG